MSDAQYALAEANEHHAMELKNSNSDHANRIEDCRRSLELQRGDASTGSPGRGAITASQGWSDHNEIVRKLYEQIDGLRQQISELKSASASPVRNTGSTIKPKDSE